MSVLIIHLGVVSRWFRRGGGKNCRIRWDSGIADQERGCPEVDRGATGCCIRSLEERHVEDGRLRQQPKANDGLGGWRLAGIYQQAGKLVVGCGKWPNRSWKAEGCDRKAAVRRTLEARVGLNLALGLGCLT